jgi:uncharacterized phage protein (TIGR01671 family)
MKQREIKFRIWDDGRKEWVHGPGDEINLFGECILFGELLRRPDDTLVSLDELNNIQALQFTGLHDKNGKEIYEGDIFRVEEDGAEDETDKIYFLVIVWVSEWAMFATLRVSDEYPAYLNEGVKALDEPMFWTYTLEDTSDRRFFLCGNIFQNPELLTEVEHEANRTEVTAKDTDEL